MFNTEYSLSQNQLSTMLQFPIEGQVYPRIPPNLNWNTVAAFDLFRKISGVDAKNWEELLISHIHNPTIRYFIRILQNTVFGRPNNSKVNAKELFFLECVFEPNAKVNAASFLFHHIRTLYARGRQPFVIGGLNTTIALGLNLGDRLQTLESLPPLFMDISYCRSSRLIKNRVGGKYYLMVNNQAVPSVVLPNIALTDVTNPNRHLYDLNAPEATEPSHTNPSRSKKWIKVIMLLHNNQSRSTLPIMQLAHPHDVVDEEGLQPTTTSWMLLMVSDAELGRADYGPIPRNLQWTE
ncbi:hypothetical protein KIW84_035983 [Lathyrus oleraceus]|uniref:Arabidopsis retrotransposon Orf1 C-terminal domain-containing protein n=1 Tax=Pisum sativum TaxID=3888 RepID=A0A9D5B351_PEA|nr:hypothetical protein KIW84_035983 [Pisum sativum]